MLIALVAALAGTFTWTFLEYGLHHWLGHLARGRNHFSREHLTHHARRGYFSPASQKGAFAVAVLGLILAAAVPLVGWLAGAAFAGGLVGGYLVYEWLHYRAHARPPRGRYGRWLRKHHFAHHFTSPKMNHGVTSPLWDWVFGTWQRVDVVRVPEKMALDWLVDPRTGDVHNAYAADYRITRPGSAARAR